MRLKNKIKRARLFWIGSRSGWDDKGSPCLLNIIAYYFDKFVKVALGGV